MEQICLTCLSISFLCIFSGMSHWPILKGWHGTHHLASESTPVIILEPGKISSTLFLRRSFSFSISFSLWSSLSLRSSSLLWAIGFLTTTLSMATDGQGDDSLLLSSRVDVLCHSLMELFLSSSNLSLSSLQSLLFLSESLELLLLFPEFRLVWASSTDHTSFQDFLYSPFGISDVFTQKTCFIAPKVKGFSPRFRPFFTRFDPKMWEYCCHEKLLDFLA